MKKILFGARWNLDFKAQETAEMELSELTQCKLEQLLKTVILPHQSYEIEKRRSGIMGMENQIKPIHNMVSKNIFCCKRFGGMGIVIGASSENN